MSSSRAGLLGRLETIIAFIPASALVLLALAITADTLARKFAGTSLPWTVEVSEYDLVYLTFLAAPWILRDNGHVSLELLVDRVSPGWRRIMAVVSHFLAGAMCLAMLGFASAAVLDHLSRGVVLTKMLQVPKWAVLLPLPVGYLLLACEFARKIVQLVRGGAGT